MRTHQTCVTVSFSGRAPIQVHRLSDGMFKCPGCTAMKESVNALHLHVPHCSKNQLEPLPVPAAGDADDAGDDDLPLANAFDQPSILYPFKLAYHQHLKALMCLACEKVVDVESALRHAQRTHQLTMSEAYTKRASEALVDLGGQVDLAVAQAYLKPRNEPVDQVVGVKVMNGLKCLTCDAAGVPFITCSPEMVYRHYKEAHVGVAGRPAKAIKMQSLFASVGEGQLRYFEVIQNGEAPVIHSPRRLGHGKWEEAFWSDHDDALERPPQQEVTLYLDRLGVVSLKERCAPMVWLCITGSRACRVLGPISHPSLTHTSFPMLPHSCMKSCRW